MQLIYRGQTFTRQAAQLHVTVNGTIQPRTFIYRGVTHTCDVLVPSQMRSPRAVNWRYNVPREVPVDTTLTPALEGTL